MLIDKVLLGSCAHGDIVMFRQEWRKVKKIMTSKDLYVDKTEVYLEGIGPSINGNTSVERIAKPFLEALKGSMYR